MVNSDYVLLVQFHVYVLVSFFFFGFCFYFYFYFLIFSDILVLIEKKEDILAQTIRKFCLQFILSIIICRHCGINWGTSNVLYQAEKN